MASSKETYCLCGQPYNIGQFMIECDCCREWFHGSCVDVKIYQSDDIDKYHCPKCAQTYGPSVLKVPTNNHRSDRYELGAEARPAQAGAPGWVRALAARPPRPLPAALTRMRGHDFTEQFVRDGGFTKPILFSSTDGLDMKVPNSATFTARSVLRYCGAQFEVEVIDVRKQATLRMPLGDFVEYFETPPEARAEKVLNLISLEFSDTNMAPLVEPPLIARSLDWATRVWRSLSPRAPARPAVAKYCLLCPRGGYTDWHVDFGGTTVWYHVLTGQKVFYLAPPTATNLALYQQWSASNNQSERFFGDMVEWYGTAEVSAGDTLVIPSGWVHAVLTPQDSLVVGGNFLHEYAIEMQLQIYEIERRVETPMVYRYPLFEAMNWSAGAHLLALLRRHNEESQDEDFIVSEHDVQTPQADLPPLLLRGIKLLANALKEWHALKSTDAAKRDNVPKCLNSGQLVRELGKELRILEKRTATMANRDKDFKLKTMTPTKAHTKKATQKKSLKLTLPKPIMHMAHLNGEYQEEKLYDKPFIETKDIIYHQDARFITQDIPQDIKYTEGLQEAKTFVVDGKELILPTDKSYLYQNYEEHLPMYTQDSNGYVEAVDKKSDILRIKMDNSPSSSREAPPPYSPLPEHSILKSHLIGRPLDPPHLIGRQLDTPLEGALKQQWTISKKDSGEFHEQILFTNENVEQTLPRQVPYGPGMYSTDDIQPEYQYVVDTKQPYQTYSYLLPREPYRYIPQETTEQAPTQVYTQSVQELPPEPYHELPSYDAAVAQQQFATAAAAAAPAHYEIEPPPAPRLRRSERPARRRVSPTYDYEDIDLYIDDAPATRRSRASNSYRAPAPRPAPANGIESLIQASVLAEEEPPTATEDAAVAGMLSISEPRYTPQRTFGLAADSQRGTTSNSASPSTNGKRTRAPPSSDDDDEEDVIKEVHRDEEYVYPSLEMSSDEDEEWTSSRRRTSRNRNDSKSKSERDSSWSPRARLGRLVPRLRSGRAARRESVRAALHHARHHADKAPPQPPNAKRAVLATKSKRPPPPAPPTPNKNNSRLKKGMKTAKQRLGKILKIHKMVY